MMGLSVFLQAFGQKPEREKNVALMIDIDEKSKDHQIHSVN